MQYQKPILRQEQKLHLTPQLYQAINLMALPIQDLRQKIQEEIERNPALEVIKDQSTVSLEEIEKKEEEYSVFEETSDPGYIKANRKRDDDSKRLFMEGTLTRAETLQDHLIWQLRLQPIKTEWFRIGELLIHNMDSNGFHIVPPEELVKKDKLAILYEMMKMIQGFEPVGVCTKDYKESLLVQIEKNEEHPLSYKIVENYLNLLEKGKISEIAKKLKVKEDTVLKEIEFIKSLEPHPGRNFALESPAYVIPDVMVKVKDSQFYIILNDEEIPVLGINPFFDEIYHHNKYSKKKGLNKFVTKNINDAKWFIRSIGHRNETLLKTCRVIVEFQREFFRKGPKYLAPLVLKDISQEIGVHEATVSRVTSGKYIQTEWGIFELKYFFSNSITGAGSEGSRYSKQAVKEIIRDIIKQENGKHYSDNRITEILESQGIKLARRTVAKYRKELDIDSSFQR